MKLKLRKDELITPLEMAAGAAERRDSDDVHAHVLIAADQGNMRITGVGTHVQVSGETQSGIEGQAATTLPARKLLDICKSLPDDSQIAIDVGDDSASLRTGRSRFKLRVFSPDSFPAHGEEKVEVSVQIAAGILRQMLSQTSFAVAQADVRQYLTGVLVEVRTKESELRTVATDGHRLAMNSRSLDAKALKTGKANAETPNRQVILPMDMVQQMRRMLDNAPDDEQVRLEFNNKSARLLTAKRQVQSLAIDGAFPDYERVIPETGNQTLQMARGALREALSRAAVLLEHEPTHIVKLQLSDKKTQIRADNQLGEEYEEDFDAEYKGEAIDIAFNLNYLREMLDAFSSAQFLMYLKDAGSSVRVEPVPAEGQQQTLSTVYVLMPMRP